ncbi:MAG: replication-associated recombination protein A, partial [Pseudomonadota bacterium]
MQDLFDTEAGAPAEPPSPLPERLRPTSLDEIAGQDHLVGADGPIRKMAQVGRLTSLILWGPPGCGKTTMARILAGHTDLHFEQLSAIFSGVADLKKVFEAARIRRKNGKGTLLFVDEIHRFNKSQQDAFLPVVENGVVTLIGATTENPSFELNSALLSRCQIFILKRMDDDALETLLKRAELDANRALPLTEEARETLKAMADGDGRYVLSMAEQIYEYAEEKLYTEQLIQIIQRRAPLYDKSDDGHYNLISALHKSVRGSDVDAALYWMARMLAGGEDPLFIARRLVRMAMEDIGLADPQALPFCLSAWDAYERLGSPEGELALVEAVIFLATAPKSNACYIAEKSAKDAAHKTGSLAPPAHILNAPTKFMKDIGYGAGYEYDHDAPGAFSGQNYFPDSMKRATFYTPVERGHERKIAERL